MIVAIVRPRSLDGPRSTMVHGKGKLQGSDAVVRVLCFMLLAAGMTVLLHASHGHGPKPNPKLIEFINNLLRLFVHSFSSIRITASIALIENRTRSVF